MPNNKTQLITKHCAVCNKPFAVCPPGKASRDCKRKHDALFCSNECSSRARFRSGKNCLPLLERDAAYIAGFLDGEGSVILYARRDAVALRVAFSNTKKNVLEWIRDKSDAGNITLKKHGNGVHADSYSLLINSQSAYSMLKQLVPYLILKQEQAFLAIDFFERLRDPKQKADRSWQHEARSKMQYLNRRGGD